MRRGKPSWWPADESVPPPPGVARTEASWFGADGRPCERDQATSVLVRHIDAGGGVIRSVWGHVVEGQPVLDDVPAGEPPGEVVDGPTVPAPDGPPPQDAPPAPAPRRAPPPPPPPAPVPPPPPAPPAPALATFEGALTIGVPPGWFVKESFTVIAADGTGNVIFSSEPLDPTLTTEQYADIQGDLLAREFPHFEQYEYRAATIMGGRPGFLRRFSWTPPDGVRVTQTQLYWVDPGRGYTATSTSTRTDFPELVWVLDSLDIRPPEP